MKKQNKLQFAQNFFLFRTICIPPVVFLVLLLGSCVKDKTSEEVLSRNQVDSRILFSADKNEHYGLYTPQEAAILLPATSNDYGYFQPKVY